MANFKLNFGIFILGLCALNCNAAKILGLFTFPGKSHFMVFRVIMTELARRGHEVTVVSNFRIDEKIPKYNELLIEPSFNYWDDVKSYFGHSDIFDVKDFTTPQIYDMFNRIGYTTTEYALKSPSLQKLINNEEKEQYDLIIVEQFFQDALLIFGKLYKAPIVAISTASFENTMSTMMGLVVPWAHSPQDYLGYSDRMTFYQRFWNSACSLYAEYSRKFHYFPQQDELIRKYFSHLGGNLPSVAELEKNVSVLLVNNFVPLDIPRPSVMGVVSVGGVHITPPKTLPRDIRAFLDDARHGAIYFSLGTNLKSSEIPEEKLKALVNVFSKLKERVLWKWDEGAAKVPKLPHNVMAMKRWIPQNDVLAHPHVKFFITHGGLLSLQEAVHRGVPVLGMPIFADQYVNVRKVVDLGIGLMLDYSNLTETSLSWALQQLIYDISYTSNMGKMSQIFRDRPLGALETSIFWIEYVIRHKGAPFIQTAAVDLPWYSLYLLDVILFVVFCLCIIIGLLYATIKLIIFIRTKRRTSKVYSKLN